MASLPANPYPWYAGVSGSDLEQGDILLACPVFVIPPRAPGTREDAVGLRTREENVIVMTQSCDLVVRSDHPAEGSEVVLCRIHFRHELAGDRVFGRNESWNTAKKGRFASYHVLNRCRIRDLELDFMLVDLSRVFTLSLEAARQLASDHSPRPRLLPPYREHLAQAFARFFMRVGLPEDIPDFR